MIKKFTITLLATLAIAFTPSFIDAKGKGGKGGGDAKEEKDPGAIFDAIDSNKDGKVTPKELADSKKFKDADKKEVGKAFSEKDANRDGAITAQEFIRNFGPEAGQKHGKGKGKGKGKGRKGGKGGGKGKGGKS